MPNKFISSIYKEPDKNREKKSYTDAFISYSRKDKEFVRKLYEKLNSKNLVIWVDWEELKREKESMMNDQEIKEQMSQ